MLECDPQVDRRQPFQMTRSKVTGRAPVRLVSGEAIVEVGQRAPRELTALFDATLRQRA